MAKDWAQLVYDWEIPFTAALRAQCLRFCSVCGAITKASARPTADEVPFCPQCVDYRPGLCSAIMDWIRYGTPVNPDWDECCFEGSCR